MGPGSPYPSAISISGMTGTVSDVNVILNSVSHAIAQDMDVLLVRPAGQNILLMSDVEVNTGFSVNSTLTFDDAAAGTIPNAAAVITGTFKPTNEQRHGPTPSRPPRRRRPAPPR